MPLTENERTRATVSTQRNKGRDGQETVTIKKSQPERKNHMGPINSNPLCYPTNLLFKANPQNPKEEKGKNPN